MQQLTGAAPKYNTHFAKALAALCTDLVYGIPSLHVRTRSSAANMLGAVLSEGGAFHGP